MFGITQALAQEATTTATDLGTAAGVAPGGGLGSMVPLVLIFAVFYFLLIRPQQKRLKEHSNMVNALRRNDKVVTSGGILGTITKVEEDAGILHVEIAPEVVIRVKRDTVTERLSAPSDIKETAKEMPKKKKKEKGAVNKEEPATEEFSEKKEEVTN